MSVGAMRHGAIDFLTKPVRRAKLLAAVERALDQGRLNWQERTKSDELRRRLDSLTPRELQVLTLVIAGRLNKQIGGELGISEKTVKAHRAQVMKKMRASSLPELVRLAERGGIRPRGDLTAPPDDFRRTATKVQ
jgi:FixJ family two-component response regulator